MVFEGRIQTLNTHMHMQVILGILLPTLKRLGTRLTLPMRAIVYYYVLFLGPIIEQATHFCDLMRYLGGEVRSDSVTGCCVPYSSDPTSVGYLSAVPENISEESLLAHQRIPRFTTGI